MKKHRKRHTHKLTIRVTPQKAGNLQKLAIIAGVNGPGSVVVKLVRNKMIFLNRGGWP